MRKLRKILKVLWKIFERFVSILPFVFVFIASIYEPNDPDLGWHLKYGEYFFKHGQLLRDNTFSVMMPDYQWANTSWLIDLLTYAVFNYGGFPGITILGAIALTLTFFFFSKAANLSLWTQTIIFPILMFFLVPVIAVSFRGQILTFMMLGILFYIIRLYSNHPRLIYLTIPLFLVWSNLHGEFLLGIAMFAVWIFFYIFQGIYLTLRRINPYKKLSKRADIYNFLKFNRKEILKLMTVYILVLLATLINPFGYEPYLAAISHIGSPQLKDIVEYLPIEFMSPLWWQQVILLCVIGLVFLTVAMHEKLVPPIYFVIISLFLYSFDVRRYIWPVYFMILPLIKVIPDYFTPPKKIVTLVCFVLLSIYLAFTVHDKLPLQRYTAYNWTSYCQQMGCSPASLEFIQKNRLDKDLFSLYGWGGWMIWNYPQVKPLIDGRMHMWTDENGYSGFADYYGYEQDRKNINDSKYNVVLMSPYYPVIKRLQKLVGEGKWRQVYQDNGAYIFVRNNPKNNVSKEKTGKAQSAQPPVDKSKKLID